MEVYEIHNEAIKIARRLYDELQTKKIPAINIEVITAACADYPISDWLRDQLIEATTRKVVQMTTIANPVWQPGSVEQAIGRSQRRTVRDIILELINDSTGIRSNQLVVDVISYIHNHQLNLNTENLVTEIESLINDGEIMEIDYTVPQSNYRIRSLLMPKGSKIVHIANNDNSTDYFLPILKADFKVLAALANLTDSMPLAEMPRSDIIATLSKVLTIVSDIDKLMQGHDRTTEGEK